MDIKPDFFKANVPSQNEVPINKPDFFRVDELVQNVIIINKSKFITTLVPISSFEEVQEQYKLIRKKYIDATHNCYACIFDVFGNGQKFSDDSEPQGTAGQPMLEVLKKQNIRMTLAVVTRYFGGIKLGAGGLVSAYGGCVGQALTKANISLMQWADNISIVCEYDYFKKVQQLIISSGGKIGDTIFGENTIIDIWIAAGKTDLLKKDIIDISLGKAKIVQMQQGYQSFKMT